MKSFIKLACVLSFIASVLSSCGNKGDLYMPKKDPDKTEQTSK